MIDALVYTAIVGLVLSLAMVGLYRVTLQSAELNRNAEDIARALRAGERWRAEVRSATAPLRLEQTERGRILIIPQAENEIVYAFGQRNVLRLGPKSERWNIALAGVKSTEMTRDQRAHATGWRWELELDQRQKVARVKPLFTFIAVPAAP